MPTVPMFIESDHPVFAGHFPNRPIVPGVLLIDRVQRQVERDAGITLGGLPVAKFFSPAAPGDALVLQYDVIASAVNFDIRCGERKIANGRFLVASGT